MGVEERSWQRDLKPEQFCRWEPFPDTIDAFFEYDGLGELHEDTPFDDVAESYKAAKSHWGDLMWENDLEYLDLEINPEVPIDYRENTVIITPIVHGGSRLNRTQERMAFTTRTQSEETPVYLEQHFRKIMGNAQTQELDDIDWMYDEYGLHSEDLYDIWDEEDEKGVRPIIHLAGPGEMEKEWQMGAAQYGLVNYLPEPLEYDWLDYTGSIDRIVVSERSMRMGDVLANQAAAVETDTIRAYVGSGHLMGIWSTLREHDQHDRVPEITLRHGARYGITQPMHKLTSYLEKKNFA